MASISNLQLRVIFDDGGKVTINDYSLNKPEDLTPKLACALLENFTGGTKGNVRASGYPRRTLGQRVPGDAEVLSQSF